MQWQFIIALVIAIPVILFPAALIWYLNVGGVYQAIQAARQRRAAQGEKVKVAAEAKGQSAEK